MAAADPTEGAAWAMTLPTVLAVAEPTVPVPVATPVAAPVAVEVVAEVAVVAVEVAAEVEAEVEAEVVAEVVAEVEAEVEAEEVAVVGVVVAVVVGVEAAEVVGVVVEVVGVEVALPEPAPASPPDELTASLKVCGSSLSKVPASSPCQFPLGTLTPLCWRKVAYWPEVSWTLPPAPTSWETPVRLRARTWPSMVEREELPSTATETMKCVPLTAAAIKGVTTRRGCPGTTVISASPFETENWRAFRPPWSAGAEAAVVGWPSFQGLLFGSTSPS
jgi:hypothetical protein